MAVAYVGQATGKTSSSTTVSFSYTNGAGTNRVLVAGLYSLSGGISSVSYAGAALTQLDVAGTDKYLFGKIAPATGSNTFSITQSSYGATEYALADFDGADQTTPFGAVVKNTGNSNSGTTGSITVPSNGIAFGWVEHSYSSNPTATAGTQTGSGASLGRGWAGAYRSTTGSLSWSATNTGAWFAMAVPISPVAGGTDATGTGSIAAVALTAPTGTASGSGNATGTGSIAAVTLTAPTGSASTSGAGNATGDIAPVTLTAPTGSATGGTSGAGTVSLGPLKNNTGTVLASEAGITVHVYATTGALAVTKTGQTSNGSGVCTVVDAAMSPSTAYRCVIVLGSGAEGMVTVTAA